MRTLTLHQFSRAEVVTVLGEIYEHSPWVAGVLFDQGLTKDDSDISQLASRMKSVVDAASKTTKLVLLNAHPELAGKLAMAGELTQDSLSEQTSAGLDKCTAEELAEFRELNAEYTARFGHPFIIAVLGLNRSDILNAFRSRVGNEYETEFAVALAEVHKIARLRLEQVFSSRE